MNSLQKIVYAVSFHGITYKVETQKPRVILDKDVYHPLPFYSEEFTDFIYTLVVEIDSRHLYKAAFSNKKDGERCLQLFQQGYKQWKLFCLTKNTNGVYHFR
jgi:hypothetical protein